MAPRPTATKTDPLESWHALQARIHELTEEQLAALIEREIEMGKNRRNMVLRMHMRMNKLRYDRERKALIKRTNEPKRHATAA